MLSTSALSFFPSQSISDGFRFLRQKFGVYARNGNLHSAERVLPTAVFNRYTVIFFYCTYSIGDQSSPSSPANYGKAVIFILNILGSN